jgi:DNA-directed RNA polymerase specialized sigma24 family protein
VIEQNWEDVRPPHEVEAIREAYRTRFKRLRAIIEDLAYSGLSHQEIAGKYGVRSHLGRGY